MKIRFKYPLCRKTFYEDGRACILGNLALAVTGDAPGECEFARVLYNYPGLEEMRVRAEIYKANDEGDYEKAAEILKRNTGIEIENLQDVLPE